MTSNTGHSSEVFSCVTDEWGLRQNAMCLEKQNSIHNNISKTCKLSI